MGSTHPLLSDGPGLPKKKMLSRLASKFRGYTYEKHCRVRFGSILGMRPCTALHRGRTGRRLRRTRPDVHSHRTGARGSPLTSFQPEYTVPLAPPSPSPYPQPTQAPLAPRPPRTSDLPLSLRGMAFDPRTSFQEDPSFTAFIYSSPRLSTSTSHPITAPYSDSSDSSGDDDDDEPLRPLRVAPSYRRPASYYATDLPDPSSLVPSSPGSSYGVVRSGADGGGGARSRQAVVNRRYPGRLPGEGDMSMEFSEGKHKRDERKHREAEERRKKHKHKEEEEKEHERREEKRHEEEAKRKHKAAAKRKRKAKAKRERKEREEHEHEHEHKHKHRAKPAPAATTDDSSSGSNLDGKKGADTGSSSD